jgi:hypothetical protein
MAGAGAAAVGAAKHKAKKNRKRSGTVSESSLSSSDSEPNEGNPAAQTKPNKETPLNTGGDKHHIAEQPHLGYGGLTGEQPVGEVNFKKL